MDYCIENCLDVFRVKVKVSSYIAQSEVIGTESAPFALYSLVDLLNQHHLDYPGTYPAQVAKVICTQLFTTIYSNVAHAYDCGN